MEGDADTVLLDAERNIQGRSQMTKDELIVALAQVAAAAAGNPGGVGSW